jgi:exodeoxyribonuclease-3
MKISELIKSLIAVVLLIFSVSAHAQEADDNFKVITYNIWNGYDWGKDEVRRAEVAKWINMQEPSIVALQELCVYTPEKLEEDASSWGHPYSVLLKTTGYSVGLTSKYPITVREKIMDGMHHGALHCVVEGIDVFVIHFHPGSIAFRRTEVKNMLEKFAAVREYNKNYMVLGDFNSLSPFDADLYDPEGYLLTRLKEQHPDHGIEEGNLGYGDLDYSVMSALLAFPLIDVCRPFTSGMEERGSFPGRVLGPVNEESEEQLVSRLERIDYILASPQLSIKCTAAKVCNGEENHYLSDHYPVMAEFDLKQK